MSAALSEVVAGRLVGTMHRLFQRSSVQIKEPMLHPTPFLFLYDHYVENQTHSAGDQLQDTADYDKLVGRVSVQSYVPIETTPYSVTLESQVKDRVHGVIKALDKAGLEWNTMAGLEKLENSVHDKQGPLAKILEEQELTGATRTSNQVDPIVFYNMLGTKDRYMGAMRDGELYSEELKDSWKANGFAIEFPKGYGHQISPQLIHGKSLGDKVEKYTHIVP